MTEQPPLEMTAEDVLEVYELLHANGIRIWIDGGWAVDALLGGGPGDIAISTS